MIMRPQPWSNAGCAAAIGARLDIESSPGHGTSVVITLEEPA
jgi:hypothetical protein